MTEIRNLNQVINRYKDDLYNKAKALGETMGDSIAEKKMLALAPVETRKTRENEIQSLTSKDTLSANQLNQIINLIEPKKWVMDAVSKYTPSYPIEVDDISKLNKYREVSEAAIKKGGKISFKLNILFKGASNQTRKIIVSTLAIPNLKFTYSSNIKLISSVRFRNNKIEKNYNTFNIPSISLNFSNGFLTDKEKSLISDYINMLHYNSYKALGKLWEDMLLSEKNRYYTEQELDHIVSGIIGKFSLRSATILYNSLKYHLIKSDRINIKKYDLIKAYDIGRINTFFNGVFRQENTFEKNLDEGETKNFKDKFRKLPRNIFEEHILEPLANSSRIAKVDNKSKEEIKKMGYNYLDLAYSSPEALSVFSVLLELFFEANNEAMIENNIEDAFEWEMIKTKAFKKKDLSSEFKELVSDIETDPIYNEKKIKEQNKKEFEKRILNLPPMKDKVAKIQRDSSISILVANGHYKEADKILKVYEKMDTNWRNALNKES